jgi:cellulose synthase/poly-beta-1,6-N-acetylglucosamine synthase-like glycosyltransferase
VPPLVSVLIPAHNEEKVIENLLRTLFEQTYKNMEIIVINDASTDNTRRILEPYAYRRQIRLLNIDPPNVGKHAAINAGLEVAKGEIIVVVDADGLLERDAVANMVRPFVDENVMSVSGNIKVANRINLLTRCQALEYIRDINIPRRAFDLLNITLVVPGPLGAFRRSVMGHVGEYDPDTVTEDFDVTVKIQKARDGRQIASRNITNAIAYTEAPEKLKDLIRQRTRWYGGMAQTYLKHRRYRMWTGSGSYSRLGVPYLFATLFVVPILELIMTGVTILAIIRGAFLPIAVAFLVFTVMETLTSLLAISMDKEDWRLAYLSPLYVLGYRQLLDLIRVHAYVKAVRGRLAWGRAVRVGDTAVRARTALQR